MNNGCKEEGEKSGLDMDTTKIKTENHGHNLIFRYKYKKYEGKKCTVYCNAPMTVQERLQTSSTFKAICKKNQKGGKKELVIQRDQTPRGAVTPNFPCCLFNDDELLNISFISSGKNSHIVETPKLPVLSPEHLVSFYIKTRGERNIRLVMKNNELKNNVDHVCVYAVKGETVRKALRRDGRFNRVIFRKGVLYEEETENTMELSNLVDRMDGQQFQFIVSESESQESSQEMNQEFETVKDEKSEVPEPAQEKNPEEDSTRAQEKKTETPVKERKPRKYPETKEIPNTQEILELLRAQHGDLLKTLKEREKLKKNVDVKWFFREEYDKSAQSFSEVKRVKQLMKLSDAVCQIRENDSPRGTGFLLFHRFVLTNAHVVGDLVSSPEKLKHNVTAAFGFEDLKTVGNVIPVKEDVVAYLKEKDDMGNHLDFALLELSIDGELSSDGQCPELLKYYSTPPIRGGVCILGHPGDGVKQMDPCFIFPKDDTKQEVQKHTDQYPNPEVVHLITQQCLAEDEEIRKTHITYHSCFFHGSSGSPLFDDQCNLIGVHTGGYCYEEGRKKTRRMIEYSLPMFPILVQIFIQCSGKRPEVVQYFENQNNMKLVLKVAKEQLQSCPQPMDTSP